MAVPRALIVLSDDGHDPTEAAVPFQAFKDANFEVQIVTEKGEIPKCDKKMLEGLTGKLLGAQKSVVEMYKDVVVSSEWQNPLSWTSPNFTFDGFDLVFFPGGHEKAVRQVIDSPQIHRLVADYFPKTRKPSRKAVGAICHGVLVLANSKLAGEGDAEGKSVIHGCTTTTLPGAFESGIFWSTRLFLGDYYKTYGAGSENVEDSVRKTLDNEKEQYKSSVGPSPFVVHDKNYNYISARFPGDTKKFAQSMVDLVKAF